MTRLIILCCTIIMALSKLYSAMQKHERDLGGGEGTNGIYGSIRQAGMQSILEVLVSRCRLSWRSTLVDIGSGLARPLAHAAAWPGVHHCIGIEVDEVKHHKAVAFLSRVTADMRRAGHHREADNLDGIVLLCQSLENTRSLDGCSHAYAFWEGFNLSGKRAVARLFASAPSLRYIVLVQRAMRHPEEEVADLGFGSLALVQTLPVQMSGSGRSFQAYVFKKQWSRLRNRD